MYGLIALLVFFSALFSLANATAHYFDQQEKQFNEKNEQIAEATAAYFQDERLSQLAHLVLSPEFTAVREQMSWGDDRTKLDELVMSSGLSEFESRAREMLTRMQNVFAIDSTYIAACDGKACYFVLGPRDYGLLEGEKLQYSLTPEQCSAGETVNLSYSEFVEKGTYGSERTTYYNGVSVSPIGEKDGEYTYWMASESDILLFMADELNHLFQVILFMIAETIVFGLIGVAVMRKHLTRPIIHIKDNAEKFTTENSVTQSAKPEDPGIRSNDELEDLSQSLYHLEKNVSKTQGELKKISEERGKLQAELSIATEIQQGVLPREFPKTDVYDLYALMDPAREVGGDFYDFFPLDEDHLCLVIGDVSDKGIPAALFMMTSKTMLKAHAMSSRDPAETLTAVNRTLCEYNPAEMFVTVWMGILDLKTGLLTASNGGHEYPMFQLGEKPFEVMEDPHGLVLGAMPAAKYRNYEVQMNPGDRLFVYSDGATDAVNTETKDFGLTRLHETVVKAAECSDVQGLITAVRKQLDDYSRGADQFDDITLLTLNYYGQKELQKGSETI